ncbi:MAG TPA: class I SAM-dependent methyltransferase [Thermoplasmata archaeon]|nr:class I SAM-dependent methyltransferase [Thermoplasmata archaeon]HTW55453.1 class I SAM-dependent methyltransferase [Thermoplasmata archaeon]
MVSPLPSDARVAKSIVRSGWDHLSEIYRPSGARSDAFGHDYADHREWLEPILGTVPRGAEVLDLGCGCGLPDARLLSDRFRVTGVDISDVQIDRARQLVPDARFVRADMTEVIFSDQSFGAVVCLYALIHVPIAEQRPLLERVFRWLVPGGLFLVISGEQAYTGVERDWLGSNAEMFWSHPDAATFEQWLREAGFEVRRRRHIPEGASGHALFLVARPSPRGPTSVASAASPHRRGPE